MTAIKVICDCDNPECAQQMSITDPDHARLAEYWSARVYKTGHAPAKTAHMILKIRTLTYEIWETDTPANSPKFGQPF